MMNNLFINFPGFGNIGGPEGLNPGFTTLGGFLSGLYNIAIFLAAFMAFYWLIWGAFQYLMARGDKENLAKARSKILWALIGLAVVILAYTIAKFAADIFPPKTGTTIPF